MRFHDDVCIIFVSNIEKRLRSVYNETNWIY